MSVLCHASAATLRLRFHRFMVGDLATLRKHNPKFLLGLGHAGGGRGRNHPIAVHLRNFRLCTGRRQPRGSLAMMVVGPDQWKVLLMRAYPFVAVLFDMDGTVIDNVPLHQAVWQEFSRRHQLFVSEHELDYAVGRKAAEVVKHFWPAATSDEVLRLVQERQELYRARLANTNLVHPVAGIEAFLGRLGGMGVPRVLATDAPPENVEAVFRKFGFEQFFEKVITSDQVQHGKPHPEIFLTAAKAVGAISDRCLVIEDSSAGIAAAKAANCACLAVSTTQSQAQLLKEGADFVASDFRTLPDELAAKGG
jgi:beta-phosphoglucomutase